MDERAKDGEALEVSGLCLFSQMLLIQIYGFLDNFFKAIWFRGIGPTPDIARFPPQRVNTSNCDLCEACIMVQLPWLSVGILPLRDAGATLCRV